MILNLNPSRKTKKVQNPIYLAPTGNQILIESGKWTVMTSVMWWHVLWMKNGKGLFKFYCKCKLCPSKNLFIMVIQALLLHIGKQQSSWQKLASWFHGPSSQHFNLSITHLGTTSVIPWQPNPQVSSSNCWPSLNFWALSCQ